TNAACHADVVSVACGSSHTCAALKDGRVVCWGDNSAGELGIGTTEAVQGSAQVLGLTDAIDVHANEYSTCALCADATARCWGNYFGATSQYYLGSAIPVPVTTPAGQLTGVFRLAVGFATGCAVTSAGTYCWGINPRGSLGFSSSIDPVAPAM